MHNLAAGCQVIQTGPQLLLEFSKSTKIHNSQPPPPTARASNPPTQLLLQSCPSNSSITQASILLPNKYPSSRITETANMAAENGTTTSVQDPSALAGGAPAESKGKGKASASGEQVEDTSMAVDDDEDEDEDEEGDEVCRKPMPRTVALRTH